MPMNRLEKGRIFAIDIKRILEHQESALDFIFLHREATR
jgi:hypothetical protein